MTYIQERNQDRNKILKSTHPVGQYIWVFSFPHLLTDMAASMVIRRQMCSVCPYLVFPNLVVNMCKKQRGNAILNRALKVVVLKRVSG